MNGSSFALLLHTFRRPSNTIKLNNMFINANIILNDRGKIIHLIPLIKSHGVPKIYESVLLRIKKIKYEKNIFIPFAVW